MTEKRYYISSDSNQNIYDTEEKCYYSSIDAKKLCDLLNDLHEEKEDWKHNCLISVSENSILWNEISILREQDAEPSDAFKNYVNGLKNKHNKLQGDLE